MPVGEPGGMPIQPPEREETWPDLATHPDDSRWSQP